MYEILIVITFVFIIYYLFNKQSKHTHFQHNKKNKITEKTYRYVYEYKKQLLFNITKLLNDLNIKFVICYGNLLEYERNEPIYQDDDIDIVFDERDLSKWVLFCNYNERQLNRYNLIFDERFKNIKQQQINGIQCKLIKFINPNNISEFKMNIHCDLVLSNLEYKNIWFHFNINFDNIRKIVLYDVQTYAPSKIDTIKCLIKAYGKNYIIPN